jgi:hypothetical protein
VSDTQQVRAQITRALLDNDARLNRRELIQATDAIMAVVAPILNRAERAEQVLDQVRAICEAKRTKSIVADDVLTILEAPTRPTGHDGGGEGDRLHEER